MSRYKVKYQYAIGGAQARRGLSQDSDFPEFFREIDEVDKEISDSVAAAEKPKTKWVMSSEGCSVSCGGGNNSSNSRLLYADVMKDLLVLVLVPRGFSPVTPVFPSPQKPTLLNSNSIWKVSPISALR